MVEIDEDPQMGFESEEDDDDLSDGESNKISVMIFFYIIQEGLKKCLAEFKRNLPWAERLDLTNYPAVDIVAKAEGRAQQPEGSEDVSAEDDFQREMYLLYRKHFVQYTVEVGEPVTSGHENICYRSKIRKKLLLKQAAMDKSEKAKKLREQRKYGKKVQTQVIQNRQKQKKAMLSAVKKYQKGMTDKLDFLEGDQDQRPKESAAKKQVNKKGPNSKKKYKDKKFGFGGKKKGSKWNTKDSHDDVSGFKARMAHGKGGKHFGKGGKTNVLGYSTAVLTRTSLK
ncbi:probable rRNA-processing protein EBP2 [Sinocyclocheilus rhinocerous]|uniref:probable rRNA-processing protein EBP2 n=1 Tax=Sinocyclocheilus rhinocerous TaxID=307959 RepID=UPI0007B81CF5|nr:PREDICTED: probable rRNA-processing protein EBP2 [Sinocyclocheilus rhinocerous]